MEQNKSYFIADVAAKDRFLKGDEPTEQVFRDLFDSLRFGKETNDTASTTRHGLIKLATQALLLARASKDGSNFSIAVTPAQLPKVKLKAGSTLKLALDVSNGIEEYELDDSDIIAAISAISVPAAGAFETIAAYTAGGVKGEYESGYQGSGTGVRIRTLPYSQAQITGTIIKNSSTTDPKAIYLKDIYKPTVGGVVISGSYMYPAGFGGTFIPCQITIATDGWLRIFDTGAPGSTIPAGSAIFINETYPLI